MVGCHTNLPPYFLPKDISDCGWATSSLHLCVQNTRTPARRFRWLVAPRRAGHISPGHQVLKACGDGSAKCPQNTCKDHVSQKNDRSTFQHWWELIGPEQPSAHWLSYASCTIACSRRDLDGYRAAAGFLLWSCPGVEMGGDSQEADCEAKRLNGRTLTGQFGQFTLEMTSSHRRIRVDSW